MATVIYRCKRCNSTRRIRYRCEMHSVGYGRKEASYYKESDNSRGPGGETCCGRSMAFGFLRATMNPDVKCNARCTHAVGFQCECSCGGENHATGGMGRTGGSRPAGLFTGLVADVAKRDAEARALGFIDAAAAGEHQAWIEARQARHRAEAGYQRSAAAQAARDGIGVPADTWVSLDCTRDST